MRHLGAGMQYLRRPAAHNHMAQTFKTPKASPPGLLGEAAEASPSPQSAVLFSDLLNANCGQSFPGGTRVLGWKGSFLDLPSRFHRSALLKQAVAVHVSTQDLAH